MTLKEHSLSLLGKDIENFHNVRPTLGDKVIIRRLAEEEAERYDVSFNEEFSDRLLYWAERRFIKEYLHEEPRY